VSVLFSREGFRALRWVVAITLLGIVVAMVLTLGSYWYWQFEAARSEQSVRAERSGQMRVENARRELNDLQQSSQNFQKLNASGMFVTESRLDLIEALQALKTRHQLMALSYNVSPQRALRITTTNYPALDVLASRVELTINARHDGELVVFLDEFPRLNRGFFPLDQCEVRRQARVERRSGASDNRGSAMESATVSAKCTMEWITLRDKRNAAQTAQTSAGNPS
jgi:hypothetical protein